MLRKSRELSILLTLLGLSAVLQLLTGGRFLEPVNLDEMTRRSGAHVILAIGQALVIITGGIDLSVGAVVALSSMVFAATLHAGLPDPAALLALFLCPMTIGLFHAWLVNRIRVPAFVATLGTFCMARSLAEVINSGTQLALPDPRRWESLYYGNLLSVPIPLWLALGVLLLAELATRRTLWGRRLYAVGGNETASFLAGVPLWRTHLSAYVSCGFCVALATLIWTAKPGQGAPDMARSYELYAIAGAVIGGTSLRGGRGTMVGAALGTLVIQVLHSAQVQLQTFIPTYWRDFILGSVLVAAVAMDALRRGARGRLPGRE